MSNITMPGGDDVTLFGERKAAGMTLRDWFAGQAIASGMLQYPFEEPLGYVHDWLKEQNREEWAEAAATIAEDAYVIADAMLKAREA